VPRCKAVLKRPLNKPPIIPLALRIAGYAAILHGENEKTPNRKKMIVPEIIPNMLKACAAKASLKILKAPPLDFLEAVIDLPPPLKRIVKRKNNQKRSAVNRLNREMAPFSSCRKPSVDLASFWLASSCPSSRFPPFSSIHSHPFNRDFFNDPSSSTFMFAPKPYKMIQDPLNKFPIQEA